MQLVLFWFFSILMLAFAVLVVVLRNPVSSAMSLVCSFLCLAALFVTLDAFFIGITQVLVYAGAVMVLFLFIIMLLDLKEEKARRIKVSAFLAGGFILAGFITIVARVVASVPGATDPLPPISTEFGSDIYRIGFEIFQNYNMPLQIVGVLLLVATIGVVILSRKELK
jgi:NADH-quinone oxidoreductase subunit J